MKIVCCCFLTILWVGISACNYNLEKTGARVAKGGVGPSNSTLGKHTVDAGVYSQILGAKCLSCHNATNAQGGASLSDIEDVRRLSERINFRALVKKDMPPQEKLSESEMNTLKNWLMKGAPIEIGTDDWAVSDIPTFEDVKQRVFSESCFQCHSGMNPEGNLDLENYEAAKAAREQIFIRSIVNSTMPIAPFDELTRKQKKLLGNWLIEGAPL